MNNLYKVTEGIASEVTGHSTYIKSLSDSINWEFSVLCIAADEAEAVHLADLYDAEEIEEDSHFYPDSYGPCIVAISQACNHRRL